MISVKLCFTICLLFLFYPSVTALYAPAIECIWEDHSGVIIRDYPRCRNSDAEGLDFLNDLMSADELAVHPSPPPRCILFDAQRFIFNS